MARGLQTLGWRGGLGALRERATAVERKRTQKPSWQGLDCGSPGQKRGRGVKPWALWNVHGGVAINSTAAQI